MFYKIQIYIITFCLLVCSILFVLPNMSLNTSSYKSEKKILKETRIQSEASRRLFIKKNRLELVLVMTDGTEWIISREFNNYWNTLQSVENIGKTYKLYLGHNISYGHNPVQIEIDGEVIYTPNDSAKWRYILLLMTVGLIILSTILIWKDIRKRRKNCY